MGKLKDFYSKRRDEELECQADNHRVFEGRAAKRSRSYRKHFEGYYEAVDVSSSGNKRIVRVYGGTLYVANMSLKKQIIYRILYSIFWLFAAFTLVFSAIQRIPANAVWYGAIVNALIVAGLLWTFVGLINYVIAPVKKTVGEWRSSSGHLRKSTIVSAGTFLLGLIVDLICMFLYKFFEASQYISIVGYTVGTIIMTVWFFTERNVVYIEEKAIKQ